MNDFFGKKEERKVIQGDGWVKKGTFNVPERDTWDNSAILPEDEDPYGFLKTMENTFRQNPVDPAKLNETMEDFHYHLKRHYRNKHKTLSPNDYRLIENNVRKDVELLEYQNIMGTAEKHGPEKAKNLLVGAGFLGPTLSNELNLKVDRMAVEQANSPQTNLAQKKFSPPADKNPQKTNTPLTDRPDVDYYETPKLTEPPKTGANTSKPLGHQASGSPLNDRPDVHYEEPQNPENLAKAVEKWQFDKGYPPNYKGAAMIVGDQFRANKVMEFFKEHGETIDKYSAEMGINPAMVYAIINEEMSHGLPFESYAINYFFSYVFLELLANILLVYIKNIPNIL